MLYDVAIAEGTDSFPAPLTLRVLKLYYKVASSQLPARQILHVLHLYYKVASSQLPAPPDKSYSRLHFAHSTRTISAEGCARVGQIAVSLHFAHLTRTISTILWDTFLGRLQDTLVGHS